MKIHKRNKDSSSQNPATIRPPSPRPTPEEILQRAYEIFLARGGTPGKELADWLLAEQQLKEKLANAGVVVTSGLAGDRK